MQRRSVRLGTGIAALALAAGVAEVGPADAVVSTTVVTCGQTIMVNTTLAGDVGPCPSTNGAGWGINIGADNITLNLNGKRVFGGNVPGEGPAVRMFGRIGAKVMNGALDHMDCGVLIEGGNGNTVTGVTAEDNIGRNPGSPCGDGIAIESSTGNLIEKSIVRRNGPYSGIGVYSLVDSDHPRTTSGTSSGNKIDLNTVYDNVASRNPAAPADTDNDGIRVEPFSVSNNLTQNYVFHNGLDGISLFNGSANNQLMYNTVQNNGVRTSSARRGSGIIVFNRANGNLIIYNYVTGNSDNGIVVQGPVGANPGALGNRILYNQSFGNATQPLLTPAPGGPFGGTTYDLQDRNGNCNLNQWYGNVYGTAFPECTKAGGTQHVDT